MAQQSALLEASTQPSSAGAALSTLLTDLVQAPVATAESVVTHVLLPLCASAGPVVAVHLHAIAALVLQLCGGVAAAEKQQRASMCKRICLLLQLVLALWPSCLQKHLQVPHSLLAARAAVTYMLYALLQCCSVWRLEKPVAGVSKSSTVMVQMFCSQQLHSNRGGQYTPTTQSLYSLCESLVVLLLAVKKPLQSNTGIQQVAASSGQLLAAVQSVPDSAAWLQVIILQLSQFTSCLTFCTISRHAYRV